MDLKTFWAGHKCNQFRHTESHGMILLPITYPNTHYCLPLTPWKMKWRPRASLSLRHTHEQTPVVVGIRMVREESVSHVLTKKTVSRMARVFIGVQWFWFLICLDALLCIFMHLQYNSCQPSWWIYYPWWPHHQIEFDLALPAHRPVDSQSLTTTPGLALHLERSWNVQPQVPLWVNHEADARNNRRGSVQWTHTLWRYSRYIFIPCHIFVESKTSEHDRSRGMSFPRSWWSCHVISIDLI